MKRGHLSGYFAGVGVKSLKATEIDPGTSNGHEFQGVKLFQAFLGVPTEKRRFEATYVWLSDDDEALSVEDIVTWYDSRRGQGHREPEPRFYYPAKAEFVVYRATPGDVLFVCLGKNGRLTFLLCRSGSTIERQLLWLFGLKIAGDELVGRALEPLADVAIGPAARYVLDLVGVDASPVDTSWLDKLIKKFGDRFPSTAAFSSAAREWCDPVDLAKDPDGAIVTWLEMEELLFYTFERHLITERLAKGFSNSDGADVDGFVAFSLSVQNRRKSRAGYSLENHLSFLFQKLDLSCERGARTEGRRKPDFLFPGGMAYRDTDFPIDRLTLLGAKSTCKDRWRQVLAEGARVPDKHLVTLEPGISVSQTAEMREERLQLVIPSNLFETYQREQQSRLMSVGGFVDLVRERQVRA